MVAWKEHFRYNFPWYIEEQKTMDLESSKPDWLGRAELGGIAAWIAFFLLVFSSTALSQTTWYVDDNNANGPWDGSQDNPFQHIQDGINAAFSGDTVLVLPGDYRENIDFLGKEITVKSSTGPDRTRIDGNQSGSVVVFQNSEGPSSALEGFLITGGSGRYSSKDKLNQGGGIHCYLASPTILNCHITGNSVDGEGGGIFCRESSPLIHSNLISENCASRGAGIGCIQNSCPEILGNTIQSNMCTADGGGIFFVGLSSPLIDNNSISLNSAPDGQGGGLWCRDNALPMRNNHIFDNTAAYGGGVCCNGVNTLANNRIVGNTASGEGGGVWCIEGAVTLVNNTLSLNTAEASGGGFTCIGGIHIISNSILWGNFSGKGKEISMSPTASLSISYSTVEGGMTSMFPAPGSTIDWGPVVLEGDPLFVSIDSRDFHLRFSSPCVDAGNSYFPNLPETDHEGDMRSVDGDLDGFAKVDMGADELVPEIAARFGSVCATCASLANVLFVNESSGDHRRVYEASTGQRITMTLLNSPAASIPVDFALYWIWWEPAFCDMAVQPANIGYSCIPMPLSNTANGMPPYPPPLTLANRIGHNWLLGNPAMTGLPPAPCTIFSLPTFPAGTYTIQGYIFDNGSTGPGVSLTNAIVLKVM